MKVNDPNQELYLGSKLNHTGIWRPTPSHSAEGFRGLEIM